MKKLFIILIIALSSNSYSQSINDDKTSVTNFIKRMYNSAPFEGVKVIDDYDHQYFISVLSLEKAKYPSESMMFRVAQVNGQQSGPFGLSQLQQLIASNQFTQNHHVWKAGMAGWELASAIPEVSQLFGSVPPPPPPPPTTI